MEPIRVLQAFTILNRGGAETMIMNYYREIDRSKVQFDFLVHRQERGAYDDEIEDLGGRIYRMPSLYPQNFITYKKQISKFLSEHKREYRIIHGNFSELGYFLYKEAMKQGVPTIICHAHNSKMSLDLKAPFRFYWKHACKNYITQMFSCSNLASEWLFGIDNVAKTIIMNNAIEPNKFSFDNQKAERMKNELGVAGKLVIGHVGRFNVQKNHVFLIKIFSEIKKKCNSAVLILVGQGDLEQNIVRKVENLGLQDSVVFLGLRTDVNEVMQAFDVFLFPSLYEGLPVTMIEAQASGLKNVVADTISKEADITGNVVFISLKETAQYWAEKVLKYKEGYSRRNMNDEIGRSGYDIKEKAKWLERFYLNEYRKGLKQHGDE